MFLQENSRAYLFVDCPDGEVRGWPMTAFYRPGLIYFTTYAKAPKAAHLERAHSATVIVATPEGRQPLDYVEVSGAVRVIAFTPEIVDRFISLTPGDDDRVDETVKTTFRDRIASGKRVLVEVDVEVARAGCLHEDVGA